MTEKTRKTVLDSLVFSRQMILINTSDQEMDTTTQSVLDDIKEAIDEIQNIRGQK